LIGKETVKFGGWSSSRWPTDS